MDSRALREAATDKKTAMKYSVSVWQTQPIPKGVEMATGKDRKDEMSEQPSENRYFQV